MSLASILREELAVNAHNNDEANLRCVCDDCVADLEKRFVSDTTAGLTSERALETDTAARSVSFDGLIALLLLRQGAWLNSDDTNPHRPIYAAAQKSAEREIAWRFAQAGSNASTKHSKPSPLRGEGK